MDGGDGGRAAPQDRAIWATWYDLPQALRGDYLAWLHDSYLPEMLDRPSILWAAHYEIIGSARDGALFQPKSADDEGLGTGKDFLLLVGATSPHAFFNPSVFADEHSLTPEARDMLGRREQIRSSVLLEEVRVDGPAVAERPLNAAPAPAIQMGTFRMQSLETDFEISAWYAQDRLPATTTMEGCVGTRKLVSTAGWAKHAVLYEFTTHDARISQFGGHERGESTTASWSKRVINSTIHAPGSPTLGVRIWPAAQ